MESFVVLFFVSSLFCGVCAIVVRNPVRNLLFFLLTFLFLSAGLLSLGLDFIAIVFVMVYVGAVAVLFLFVLMLLRVRWLETRLDFVSITGGLLFSCLLGLSSIFWVFGLEQAWGVGVVSLELQNWVLVFFFVPVREVLGYFLYDWFFMGFLVVGVCLLVAMLGVLVITSSVSCDE